MRRFPFGVTQIAASQLPSHPESVEFECWVVPPDTGRIPPDVQSRPLRPGFFARFEQLGRMFALAFRVAIQKRLAKHGLEDRVAPESTETVAVASGGGPPRADLRLLAQDCADELPALALSAFPQKDSDAGR